MAVTLAVFCSQGGHFGGSLEHEVENVTDG